MNNKFVPYRSKSEWRAERQERLRQQRRQKALREASKRAPQPVTVTKIDGSVEIRDPREHTATYERYIQSDKWDRRKVAYFAKNDKICWRCGGKNDIHLHHHTYERLGREHDEDLVPLCQTCHKRVHQLHRTGKAGNLTRATQAAILEHPFHRNQPIGKL